MMGVNSFILSYLFLTAIQTTLSKIFVYNNSNKIFEEFQDEEGKFYPSFPSEGLTGYVTTTNPPNACTKIAPPPDIPTFGYQWIALIPRTRGSDVCEFALKIQNAHRANFSAAIIYNYEDGYIPMGPMGENVGIPSTLITLSKGLLLMKKYLYNITSVNSSPIYHLKIVPDEPFNIITIVIIFVSTISILFLVLMGCMLVKCYLHRRHTRRHRLPRSSLKQLKIKKFVKGDPWEVCAICLDDYEDGAKIRILPCDHAYHMKCIDPWLLNNRSQCPVCKRYVFPNNDNSDEENGDHQPARRITEQTPLISADDNNSETDRSRNRQLPERQLLNPLGSGAVPNVSFASNESSIEDKDLFLSTRQITTSELAFERPSSNSRRYGSTLDSSTTSHAANFFVGSLGGTTDNTNVSGRSIIEGISDIESIDDDDERMHSVVHGSEENSAYVNDEQSTETIQTHL